MKRSKTASRAMRNRSTTKQGTSKYARKLGRQMYGNGGKYHGGCCAHGIKIAGWAS